ncbi:MAG: gamma-glutamyl-gamma-aminobutyrate hydrolase family protein [Pirellulales bacterium]|nr:gamma-glutamyl-gamma-aminobutyrate hydrolase family protein [Pirellulales bacterium]
MAVFLLAVGCFRLSAAEEGPVVVLIDLPDPAVVEELDLVTRQKEVRWFKDRLEEISGLKCVVVQDFQAGKGDSPILSAKKLGQSPVVKAVVVAAPLQPDEKQAGEVARWIRETDKPLLAVSGGMRLLCRADSPNSPLPLGEGQGVRANVKESSPHPNPLPKGEGTTRTAKPPVLGEGNMNKTDWSFDHWDCKWIKVHVRTIKGDSPIFSTKKLGQSPEKSGQSPRDPLFAGMPDELLMPEEQAIAEIKVPGEFEVLAESKGGKPQVVRVKDRPVYGVRFQPELYDYYHTDGRALLQNFFRLAGIDVERTAPAYLQALRAKADAKLKDLVDPPERLRSADRPVVCGIDMENPDLILQTEKEPAGKRHSDGLRQFRRRMEKLSGTPCLIVHYTQIVRSDFDNPNIRAVLIMGQSGKMIEPPSWELIDVIRRTDKPILGLCRGHQLIAEAYGEPVAKMRRLKPGEKDPDPEYMPGYFKESGFLPVPIVRTDPLWAGCGDPPVFHLGHCAEIKRLPANFVILSGTAECRIESIKHPRRLLYGVQFHPEKYDKEHLDGKILLQNFFHLAGLPPKDDAEKKGQAGAKSAEDYDRLRVGETAEGRTVVPTNQVLSPLGEQVRFPFRPTAVALSPDRRWLGVLGHDRVLLIDLDAKRVTDSAPIAGSFTGIVFTPDGKELLASSLQGKIEAYSISATPGTGKRDSPIFPAEKSGQSPTGKLVKSRSIPLSPRRSRKSPGAIPSGLAINPGGKTLWVVQNRCNEIGEVDLASGRELRRIPVGNAPYDVVCVQGKVYVSNWAGRHPGPDDPTGPSGSAARVRVDPKRRIASEGSVSVVDPVTGKAIKEIVVGPHASGLTASPDGRCVCVACANADVVAIIDTRRDEVVEEILTRPSSELPWGSSPNALAFGPEGKRLYVSNGTNNAVAVIAFDPPKSRLLGFLPAGWYPAGLVYDPQRHQLCVANVKGIGSRNIEEGLTPQRKADLKEGIEKGFAQSTEVAGIRKVKGKNVWGYFVKDYTGTVSLIPLPKDEDLPRQTAAVLANNRLSVAEQARAKPRPDAPPRPVPERLGEPSVFKHVLYVIKENRTYDQVFGDLPEGEGCADLCIFGDRVTPNHHRLAREFVLLDNFYCCGVISADGHQWTDEAFATDYIEKSFGGWPRSYPYWGGDAMAYARSGFIWDNALEHRRSLRVYGEFVKATVRWKDPLRTGTPTFLDCYRDYRDGTGKIEIRARASIKTLQPHICPTAIGFPGIVSDQYRADQFIRELREFERRDDLPNLMIMLLPNDHTAGTRPGMPTPEAAVADNDLALGRIIEALSRSKFWPETCVFVVEDDPQNGFDHIDGHRTVALVVSPYSRRRGVDSTNYNQTSMVRSIEQILGLPPMNQFDASATPMASCFSDRPDLTPYTAVKNHIPLDRLNPAISAIQDPAQRRWAEASLKLPLDDVDQADEDTLNRILWHAQTGRDDTYPAWAVLERDADELNE